MKKTILVVAIIFSLFSCSKDDEPTPEPAKTYDIKGYYQGTSGNGTSDTGASIAMIIEENGKATFIANSKFNGATSDQIYYGTYTLTGNQITITTTRLSSAFAVNFTGTFEPTTGKLSGSWTNENTISGKFKINKNITGKDNLSGYWKGTYTNTNNGGGTYDYIMIAETDGTVSYTAVNATVTNTGKANTAYGTHAIVNNNYTATIKYNLGEGPADVFNVATFDSTNGKLINGTWQNPMFSINGTWILTKMYY